MSDWTLSLDAARVIKRLGGTVAGLTDRRKLHERITISWQRRVYKGWGQGWPALSEFTMLSRRGSARLSDKGLLKLSLTGSNPSTISTAEGTLNLAGKDISILGSRLPYAALQNFGGTVRPVRAQLLAMPATEEAREAGSPLNFDRPLFFLAAKSGRAEGWWAERQGTGKAALLLRHYLLTKESTIPPTGFFPTPEQAMADANRVGAHYVRELISGGPQQEAA